MSLDPASGRRSESPEGSGRASPEPRALRRTVEDGTNKGDKHFRRYAANLERTLASWEVSPQEWADYIAFLGRLLKAIQVHPQGVDSLPHTSDVASKLAQCLNPALPSGVHQKALEVYTYIFSIFGESFVSKNLHHFLPGLCNVLAFASLSVRPALYNLFEDFIVKLPLDELRPALKALILSLLPALEEETSEDFERAFGILQAVEKAFSDTGDHAVSSGDDRGYFWQCLFLAIITSPTRRQGGLNYLVRKLPKFGPAQKIDSGTPNGHSVDLNSSAEAVISPEPGLLIRCFVCGLSDSQVLIQRGFLDLLVSNLPLGSPVVQQRARQQDLDLLVSAAAHVLLRRDMSLNRRLWTWFLNPKINDGNSESQPTSPSEQRKPSNDEFAKAHFIYFDAYGKRSLERSILKMFQLSSTKASEKAKPFRICLSLMDRGEIGGAIVPSIFLVAVNSVYSYSWVASSADVAEVLRSASLFFDGIEADLIWNNLMKLLRVQVGSEKESISDLRLFTWIIQHFNLQDEDMLTIHLPYASLYLLSVLSEHHALLLPATAHLALDLLLTMINTIPRRVFGSAPSDDSNAPQAGVPLPKQVRETLEKYYAGSIDATSSAPFSKESTFAYFESFLALLISDCLTKQLDESLAQAVAILLALRAKSSSLQDLNLERVHKAVREMFKNAQSTSKILSFLTISSTLTLMATLEASSNRRTLQDVVQLVPDFTTHIWRYLSPTSSKYHVEAVKLLWQLEDLISPNEGVEATLTALISQAPESQLHSLQEISESVRCFGVLWAHTIPGPSSGTRAGMLGVARRSGSGSATTDITQLQKREGILTGPLMLVIDNLGEPGYEACEVVRDWLNSLPSIERVFALHFDRLLPAFTTASQSSQYGPVANKRQRAQTTRELEYVLAHLRNMLHNGTNASFHCLEEMSVDGLKADGRSGLTILSELCVRILSTDTYPSPALARLAIDILSTLLQSPSASALRALNLDIDLLERLMVLLTREDSQLQRPLLRLISLALKLRIGLLSVPESIRRPSTGSKRPSSASSRPEPTISTTSLSTAPPPQLLACLRLGFSTKASRLHLDQWLEFLMDIMPVFTESIFSNLIPLVECLCQELHNRHEQLLVITQQNSELMQAAPESEAMTLLEGLEIILARAHECLDIESATDAAAKPSSSSQNLLSNVTSGVFRAEGFSKTAQANSRLTVILAFQDAIRVCMELWVWANHSTETERFDKNCAATTAFNALRLRNRTRHLLEQIFAVESLESLEVVIARWCYETNSVTASASVDLLHVMQGSRPKNVVPAILDAMCSRTNFSALPANRLSSQTIDLAPLDVALFLSAYIESIEDDAMDEVWSELLLFWKEVLANPLPHRQVLPALLSAIFLVAQKVEKTNFGDQRKMRRELGDIFQRLLAATFTAIPSGYVAESADRNDHVASHDETNSSRGARDMGLVAVLARVTSNVEVVLESNERAAAMINNISAQLIGPIFHAKSFPRNVTTDTLALLLQMARKAPTAKSWRKDLSDAFNDPKILTSPPSLVQSHWFPVLHQWSLHDKERMLELIGRLVPPSTAGIMFGVGANAARLDADRKTQLNLRRTCLLMLASPEDTYVAHLRTLEEKLVELFDASASSSPSSAVKAELFMLCRAIILATSSVQLAPLWPVINQSLQSALVSLLPNASSSNNVAAFSNLTLLQACKLLDLLVALSPDEFQLHEWLYISDTIDAVYKPADWNPSALADQIADTLATTDNNGTTAEDGGQLESTPTTTSVTTMPTSLHGSQQRRSRRPLIANDYATDKEDWKAMAREDFVRSVLRPFFSQLSLHAYEGVYSLETPETEVFRKGLLEDLLDLTTIVE